MADNDFALRSVVGYVLYQPPRPLPKGVTGIQALAGLVAAKAKTSRPIMHFDLGLPEVLTGDEEFNTRVLVKPTPAAELSGQMYFRYNRLPLSRMLPGAGTAVSIGSATTVSGLLATLNTASGLTLTMDDLVEASFPVNTPTFTLTAKDTSRFFIPGTTFKVGQENTEGPAWFLLDADTLTDRMGSTPTIASGTTTVDPEYTVDGRPSRVVPINAVFTVTLATPFDMTLPEWTVEWSARYNNGLNNYATLFQLTTNGAAPGFLQRQGNAGFGNRIQHGTNLATLPDCYHVPFGTVTKNGTLVKYAIVRFQNVITLFVDGVPTMLAQSTTTAYNQKGVPASATVPPATINRLIFGGQGVGFNMGSVRISKFARYFSQYTPTDI